MQTGIHWLSQGALQKYFGFRQRHTSILYEVVDTVKKLKSFFNKYSYKGINSSNASDENAGQNAPYFHIHSIPRAKKGVAECSLEEIQEKIAIR
ncbi:MAG: hypothetical protein ACLRI7_12210 [Ruthenibacterium lactatiformans]|uniref:hypothetical protein n=1 Tax=Ruthenibacterium lactatiformans TaxID=1550024 RepID=UPI002494C2CB|nr:hypothetical protein [Ruthenibacterium lactatiformans]MEE1461603.1 hypothetical protein [Ruthenibacterium lactatiformans]